MKLIEGWKAFTDSLGTQGGSLLLLTVILFAFFPLLLKHDSEGWKAVTFILGAIAGLINANRRPDEPPTAKTKKESDDKNLLNE